MIKKKKKHLLQFFHPLRSINRLNKFPVLSCSGCSSLWYHSNLLARSFFFPFLSIFAAMFDSISGFITQAVSSSSFVFCVCNLIVVFILVGSKSGSKSGSNSDDQEQFFNDSILSRNISKVSCPHEASELSRNTSEVSCPHEASVADEEEYCRNNKKKEDDHEGEDELRRKVEEYIDKVNKGWRAELLRSSRLV